MYGIPENAQIVISVEGFGEAISEARQQGRRDMCNDIKRHLGISTNISFDDVLPRLTLKESEATSD